MVWRKRGRRGKGREQEGQQGGPAGGLRGVLPSRPGQRKACVGAWSPWKRSSLCGGAGARAQPDAGGEHVGAGAGLPVHGCLRVRMRTACVWGPLSSLHGEPGHAHACGTRTPTGSPAEPCDRACMRSDLVRAGRQRPEQNPHRGLPD